MAGWINCDLYPAPHVDEAFDVQKDWPFPTGSVADIYASHMLEHLSDPHAFFREAWRVLRPNGSMLLRTPHGGHRAAWGDLTHVRPWFPETFAFVQPGYAEAIRNPQSDAWRAFFGIHMIEQRVAPAFAPWLRHWWGRRLLQPWADHLQNFVEEIWAHLFALKTPDSVAEYQRSNPGNVVGARYVMFRCHLDPSVPPGPESVALVPLDTLRGWRA